MHELSVVENIINIITNKSKKDGFNIVKHICLEIGELSCISIEALEFCFEITCKNTILEDAKIDIISVPGRGLCNSCGQKVAYKALYEPCPLCNNYDITKLEGFDMRIKNIKVQ